jgi:hypothetical protein
MDNHTPPPNEIIHLINISPPNIKQAYKNSKKVKKNENANANIISRSKIYKPQKIRDINSKNQKKKKAKQLARQLFKLSKKIGKIL